MLALDKNLGKADVALKDKLEVVVKALKDSKISHELCCALFWFLKDIAIDTKNENMEEMLKGGVIPILSMGLQSKNQQIVSLSTLITANLTAISNTLYIKEMYDNKILDILVTLLPSSTPEVKRRCLCALGNIAIDSTQSSNYLINTKLIEEIIALSKPGEIMVALIREACWIMYVLCKNQTSFDRVLTFINN